jgi:hypothetical protein
MDAADLLAGIAQKRRNGFALVVHSHMKDEEEELRARGADVILRRPASSEEMIEAVRVAFQKRKHAKPLALMVGAGHPSDHLRQLLSQNAIVPLFADSLEEGLEKTSDYAADIIFLTEDSLCGDWGNLSAFRKGGDPFPLLAVVCKDIARAHRKKARQHNVEVLGSGRELEDAVRRIVHQAQRHKLASRQETSSSPTWEASPT